MLAVGTPMLRPICRPYTTRPIMKYARPSSFSACAKSPAASTSRMRVLDTRSWSKRKVPKWLTPKPKRSPAAFNMP